MLNSNFLDRLPTTELTSFMLGTAFFRSCLFSVSYVESLRFFLVFSLSFASFCCIYLMVLAFAYC